jgi:hypothetical protein
MGTPAAAVRTTSQSGQHVRGDAQGEDADFASPTPTIPAPRSSVSLAQAATGSTLGGPSQLLLQRLTSTAQQMFPAGAPGYLGAAAGARPAVSGGHKHEQGRGVPATHPWSTAAAGLRTPASTFAHAGQQERHVAASQLLQQRTHPRQSRSLGHPSLAARDCPDTAGCSGTAFCTGAATADLAAEPRTAGNNEPKTLDRLRGFTTLKLHAGAFSGLASGGGTGAGDVMQTPINNRCLHAPVFGKSRTALEGGGSAIVTQAHTCGKAAPPSTGGATAHASTQPTQHLSQIVPATHLLHSGHHRSHVQHPSAVPSTGGYTPEHLGNLEVEPTGAGLHEGMGEAGSCQQKRQQEEPQLQPQSSVEQCVEIGALPGECHRAIAMLMLLKDPLAVTILLHPGCMHLPLF